MNLIVCKNAKNITYNIHIPTVQEEAQARVGRLRRVLSRHQDWCGSEPGAHELHAVQMHIVTTAIAIAMTIPTAIATTIAMDATAHPYSSVGRSNFHLDPAYLHAIHFTLYITCHIEKASKRDCAAWGSRAEMNMPPVGVRATADMSQHEIHVVYLNAQISKKTTNSSNSKNGC